MPVFEFPFAVAGVLSGMSAPGPSTAIQGNRVEGIDALRGIAALSVALFHFTNNGQFPQEHWLTRLCYEGHRGVNTFFVISGFVIPYAMLHSGYTMRSVLPFLHKRFRRIYPPYAACVLVALALAWFQARRTHTPLPFSSADIAAHFLYLNEVLGRPWLLQIFWTLAVEVQYYIFLALAWPLVSSRSCLSFLALASSCATARMFLPGGWHLAAQIDYFLPGLALFRLFTRTGRSAIEWSMLISTYIFVWHLHGLPAFVAAFIPLPVVFCVRTVPAPLRFLGSISYSLYLFHLPSGGWLASPEVLRDQSFAVRTSIVALAIALAIVGAWLACRWLEEPSIRWSKRLHYRRSLNDASEHRPLISDGRRM